MVDLQEAGGCTIFIGESQLQGRRISTSDFSREVNPWHVNEFDEPLEDRNQPGNIEGEKLLEWER
jgi:hypothetical protein